MEVVTEVASTIFGGVWDMLLNTDFPGIGVSLAGLAIALLLARFSIRIFQFITGFGLSSGEYGKAASSAEKLKSEYDKRKQNQ